MREEKDSLGTIKVPSDKMWGAQTERAHHHFAIGSETIPIEVVHALALVKKAAAIVNEKHGCLSKEKKDHIVKAADIVLSGSVDDHFPLSVWQTGSGTQTNMNVNEVIANLISQDQGTALGSKTPVHPNDDVNKSQSSNDVFPTAMHVATKIKIEKELLPILTSFEKALEEKVCEFKDIVKIGRTHLMDAVPLTLGQEFSAYKAQMTKAKARIKATLEELGQLPIGGTAVGTGLNAPKTFGIDVASEVSSLSGLSFTPVPNKFEMIASEDASVAVSGALKSLAVSLAKIGGDIRLLGSGPRCGIGELILPANEPGSSIMPGKVNPTQCEALTQIAVHVMGSDAAISFAGAQGQFQLNTYRPMIIYNLLQAITLLSDGMKSFEKFCLKGLKANNRGIEKHLNESLMLVTALNPVIGYDKAAQVAKKAFDENKTLKQAALELKFLTEKEFDAQMNPKKMTGV